MKNKLEKGKEDEHNYDSVCLGFFFFFVRTAEGQECKVCLDKYTNSATKRLKLGNILYQHKTVYL